MKFLKWFSIPRDSKDLFIWILRLVLSSSGAGGVLGFIALLIVGVTIFGFLHGGYTSTGTGNVTPNGLQLSKLSSNKDKALLTHDNEVADEWQKGLTTSQIEQVQKAQVDIPGAVLLSIGKLVNNFNPPNAHLYMKYLMPHYTWKTFDNITIHYYQVQTKHGIECMSNRTVTPVVKLMTANTWDGTLKNSYHWVTTGTQSACSGTYTKTIHLTSSNRKYNWSRVWALFSHVKLSTGEYLQQNSVNQNMLAGLIGSVDYSLTDPYVQQMVSVILFNSTGISSWNGNLPPASKNTIHNILRFKSYILQASKNFHIPAVLIAGVMYQESRGREHNPDGTLVISSAGAIGLMQVEPSTAQGLTLNGSDVGSAYLTDLANPVMNIDLGAAYLSELYHRYGDNVVYTLGAYNAGPGAETQAIAKGEQYPPYAQTEQYVQSITSGWVPALTKYFGTMQSQP